VPPEIELQMLRPLMQLPRPDAAVGVARSTLAGVTCGRGCSGDDEGGEALQSKTVGLGELMVTMCWLCGARGSNCH